MRTHESSASLHSLVSSRQKIADIKPLATSQDVLRTSSVASIQNQGSPTRHSVASISNQVSPAKRRPSRSSLTSITRAGSTILSQPIAEQAAVETPLFHASNKSSSIKGSGILMKGSVSSDINRSADINIKNTIDNAVDNPIGNNNPDPGETIPATETSVYSPVMNAGTRTSSAGSSSKNSTTSDQKPERRMQFTHPGPIDTTPISPERVGSAASISRRLTRRSSAKSTCSSIDANADQLRPLEEVPGRVNVFVRVRPLAPEESPDQVCTSVTSDQPEITILDGKRDQSYHYDGVFGVHSTNKEIFEQVGKPVVNAALNGFNGTLMAYGQTGTGKTYSLTSADGLTPRLVNFLFHKIRKDREKHDYKVICSYVQIYNERIFDLLASRKKTTNGQDRELDLRENPEKGFYLDGLTEYVVSTPKEIFDLIKLGRSRLIFAETKMNRASSRSHALCMLTVERTLKKSQHGEASTELDEISKRDIAMELQEENTETTDFIVEEEGSESAQQQMSDTDSESVADMFQTSGTDLLLRGRITICDLAGSERIKRTNASGDRLNEAQQINLSLLELGNVIQALSDVKRTHVPFRNSILTRILQESLGGNCKTSLLVCVSPCRKDLSESKGTLQFGFRAMRVKNHARMNVEIDFKALADVLSEQMQLKEAEYKLREQGLMAQLDAVRAEVDLERNKASVEATKEIDNLSQMVADLVRDLDAAKASVQSEKGECDVVKTKLELLERQVLAELQADKLFLLHEQIFQMFQQKTSEPTNLALIEDIQRAMVMQQSLAEQSEHPFKSLLSHLNKTLEQVTVLIAEDGHPIEKRLGNLSSALEEAQTALSRHDKKLTLSGLLETFSKEDDLAHLLTMHRDLARYMSVKKTIQAIEYVQELTNYNIDNATNVKLVAELKSQLDNVLADKQSILCREEQNKEKVENYDALEKQVQQLKLKQEEDHATIKSLSAALEEAQRRIQTQHEPSAGKTVPTLPPKTIDTPSQTASIPGTVAETQTVSPVTKITPRHIGEVDEKKIEQEIEKKASRCAVGGKDCIIM